MHTFTRCQPHKATVRMWGLAQEHLDTHLGGAGDRTKNLLVTSQPALPPEPHAATCSMCCCLKANPCLTQVSCHDILFGSRLSDWMTLTKPLWHRSHPTLIAACKPKLNFYEIKVSKRAAGIKSTPICFVCVEVSNGQCVCVSVQRLNSALSKYQDGSRSHSTMAAQVVTS